MKRGLAATAIALSLGLVAGCGISSGDGKHLREPGEGGATPRTTLDTTEPGVPGFDTTFPPDTTFVGLPSLELPGDATEPG